MSNLFSIPESNLRERLMPIGSFDELQVGETYFAEQPPSDNIFTVKITSKTPTEAKSSIIVVFQDGSYWNAPERPLTRTITPANFQSTIKLYKERPPSTNYNVAEPLTSEQYKERENARKLGAKYKDPTEGGGSAVGGYRRHRHRTRKNKSHKSKSHKNRKIGKRTRL